MYGRHRPQLIVSEPLVKPNPRCYICRNSYISLKIDTESSTVQDLIDLLEENSLTDVEIQESGRWVPRRLQRPFISLSFHGFVLTGAPDHCFSSLHRIESYTTRISMIMLQKLCQVCSSQTGNSWRLLMKTTAKSSSILSMRKCCSIGRIGVVL